jgi:hypothetical protein
LQGKHESLSSLFQSHPLPIIARGYGTADSGQIELGGWR